MHTKDMWGDGCVNYLDGGNHSKCVYVSNHNTVHFKYLNDFICQWYLNKSESFLKSKMSFKNDPLGTQQQTWAGIPFPA